MREWRSNLCLPESAIREANRSMRNPLAPDTGNTALWPLCDRCSKQLGTAFAVEEYGLADTGYTLGGEPYTDIKAQCHGEEEVVRIEGFKWDIEGDAERGEIIRAAAQAAIVFFAPSGIERRIPASVFRAFIGGH